MILNKKKYDGPFEVEWWMTKKKGGGYVQKKKRKTAQYLKKNK